MKCFVNFNEVKEPPFLSFIKVRAERTQKRIIFDYLISYGSRYFGNYVDVG